jgi:MoaA/NifB/PqqE/SkfB family radical SAM enzyme
MLSRLVRKSWEGNHLFSVLVELTYRCNWDCVFCYNDLGLHGTPLSTEQYFDLFAELRDLGVLNLILSGGEPLAHPDFLAIGERAREEGFVIRLKSNGHALRGRLAREVKERVDPFVVEVSLHGASAEVHDRQTRVPGSFERLLKNLRELKSLGYRLKINSVLTTWNEHQIDGMFGIADQLAVPLQIEPDVTPRDDGDRSPLSLSPSRSAMQRLFERVASRSVPPSPAADGVRAAPRLDGQEPAQAGAAATDEPEVAAAPQKHCGAGSSALAIDPFGNVYPCVQWRRAAGNLHNRRVTEIWRSSPVLGEIRDLTQQVHQKLSQLGADSGRRMAFCPGSAELHTGDPLAIYLPAEKRLAAHQAASSVRSLPILDVG